MGVRKTTDFLEKATWTLAICIAILSVVAAYTLPSRGEMGHDSVLMENALNDNAVNPETLPGFEAPAATEEAGNYSQIREQKNIPGTSKCRVFLFMEDNYNLKIKVKTKHQHICPLFCFNFYLSV